MKALFLAVPLLGAALTAAAGELLSVRVPIVNRGSSTFYINGHIEGFGATQLLVDTGSGYTTINEETLMVLRQNGRAEFVKKLQGIMADGSSRIVQVYRLASIVLGENCVIRNVEAAVLPARTRPILGINTLRRVSPFTFSVDPPSLELSNCVAGPEPVLEKGVRQPAELAPIRDPRREDPRPGTKDVASTTG